MTIVAGFRSWEGVVLCADTQETVSNLSKRNVPKLIFQPVNEFGTTIALNADDLAIAFCGAADNGAFVDKLVEMAWEDAQTGSSIDEVCRAIESSIKNTYREFGSIYQTGYCPSADLIYGVKMFGSSKLFSATGPIVTESRQYTSGGIGYYMADFLSARMYRTHLSLRQCVILAAYILFQAKEHVEGCGGDSHIAVLRDDGASGLVDWNHVTELNKILKSADHQSGDLILETADMSLSTEDFKTRINDISDFLISSRDEGREALERHAQFMASMDKWFLKKEPEKKDEFGLPMPPSTPET